MVVTVIITINCIVSKIRLFIFRHFSVVVLHEQTRTNVTKAVTVLLYTVSDTAQHVGCRNVRESACRKKVKIISEQIIVILSHAIL